MLLSQMDAKKINKRKTKTKTKTAKHRNRAKESQLKLETSNQRNIVSAMPFIHFTKH